MTPRKASVAPGFIVGAILAFLVIVGLKAFAVMLLLGALHGAVAWVPALGFVPSLWLVLLVVVLFGGASLKPRSQG